MGNAVFDYIHIDDVDYFQFIRIPKFQFSCFFILQLQIDMAYFC